jgi:hypothetical protein
MRGLGCHELKSTHGLGRKQRHGPGLGSGDAFYYRKSAIKKSIHNESQGPAIYIMKPPRRRCIGFPSLEERSFTGFKCVGASATPVGIVILMSKTIEVTLIGCAGLMGKQDSGFSDPVVHLNCNGRVQVSTVKNGTNSPAWNETFCWTVPSSAHGVPLTLHVWNSPKFALGPDTKGAFLGTVTLDDVYQVRGKVHTMVLQKRSSRSNVSGSISIRVDDDHSKALLTQANIAAARPSPVATSASDSGLSAPPSCDHGRAASNLSADDAKSLADFVSRPGNEQCADCDSKQVT